MKLLQLTGLVLTVSTLYVWSRVPVTSFDASVDANRLVAKEERPRVSQGRGSHASSLKAYGQSEVNKGNAGPIRLEDNDNAITIRYTNDPQNSVMENSRQFRGSRNPSVHGGRRSDVPSRRVGRAQPRGASNQSREQARPGFRLGNERTRTRGHGSRDGFDFGIERGFGIGDTEYLGDRGDEQHAIFPEGVGRRATLSDDRGQGRVVSVQRAWGYSNSPEFQAKRTRLAKQNVGGGEINRGVGIRAVSGRLGAGPSGIPSHELVALDFPHAKAKGPVTRTISTYSDYYIGRKMSNGVKYDPDNLTVASNDWKLGSRLRITYNGKSVTATLTDRMAKRFSGIRVDASTAVWKALGGGKPGLLKGATVEAVKL